MSNCVAWIKLHGSHDQLLEVQDVHTVPGSKKAKLSTEKDTFLVVVCNENKGGSGRWYTFGIGLGSWLSSLIQCISVSAK